MLLTILAAAFTINLLITAVLGIVVGAGTALGAVGKRQRDLAELYKGLYEGKSLEVKELRDELGRVETRLALYESDFTKKVAEGVTEAIVRSVSAALPELFERWKRGNDHA